MAGKSNLRRARLVGLVLAGTITAVTVINSRAAEIRPDATVCMGSGIIREAGLAQAIAKKMFKDIGVTIDFHAENKCPANEADAIHIKLETGVVAERFPGGLAFAMPYEGVHIVVFADRVRRFVDAKRVPHLLGHVLVHEITHILQGFNRHSQIGVMKAIWDEEDHRKMGWKPLAFTDEDVRLIRFGLEARMAKQNGRLAASHNPDSPGIK